jgi:hypothetical protein
MALQALGVNSPKAVAPDSDGAALVDLAVNKQYATGSGEYFQAQEYVEIHCRAPHLTTSRYTAMRS